MGLVSLTFPTGFHKDVDTSENSSENMTQEERKEEFSLLHLERK